MSRCAGVAIIFLLVFGLPACSARKPVTVPVTDAAPARLLDEQADIQPLSACATIAAVGDMMLGGSAQPYMKPDYGYAFSATQPWLQQADIAIGNLETSLTKEDNDWVEKKYRFRNDPAVALALSEAGFDLVSLANNHTMDYGPAGLIDTLAALRQADVLAHGAGKNAAQARKPVVIGLPNGLKLGFLAYSNTFPEAFWATHNGPGTAFGHQQNVVQDVSSLKKEVDFVVVSFHWGREKYRTLREYQPILAHAAIDAGAGLILGHHPHVLQGVERYRQGLIFYSLGNFSFGSFSPSAKTSVIAQINLCNNGSSQFELLPINVNNFEVYFNPRPLEGEQAAAVLQELQSMSSALGIQFRLEDNRIMEFVGQEVLVSP